MQTMRRIGQVTTMAFKAGLLKVETAVSLDGKGAWRDNIFVEFIWCSIKYDEVYVHAYKTVSEAQA